ncbi:hypothetical protein [Methylomonas albis]|uniref:Cytochrome c7-like domain-containing protein n=1 Tax=Methylomonas albis TaxID=1854563 RepID=A0ABR9D345_9GAMM|nr:cytochrome c3 family protein [Methylomonas albis]MBD9357221.1 hypothetical protein [Methylomonas albis]CAD6880450.1 hypothetical protein [Methylomonas albis]
MNKLLYKCLLAGGTGALLLLFVSGAHTADDNPHLISKQSSQSGCTNCHTATPQLKDEGILQSKNITADQATFSKDGVAMCSSCHNPNQGHKVGLNIDFPVPADLPLNEDNDITCLTCHYTHGKLDSDRPQASHSFMDKLMNAERLKKSFLLRRNNSDGELCLTCHNTN